MTEGKKFDTDKPDVGLVFESFPRALIAVAHVATAGSKKYSRGDWVFVNKAKERYNAAKGRHILKGYIQDIDPEFNFPEKAHEAWNALATLELFMRENYTDEAICKDTCFRVDDKDSTDQSVEHKSSVHVDPVKHPEIGEYWKE